MTYQDALRKVAKLLKLAESSNMEEAATAAAQAQRLMDTYKIEAAAAQIEGAEEAPEEDILAPPDPLETFGKNLPSWKGRLAMIVSKANQCMVYQSRKGDGAKVLNIIGGPSDIQTVRYLYAHLSREIERITEAETVGCGRTYRNNFRIGACETLEKRLREQHAKTEHEARQRATGVPGERALVVVNRAIERIEKRGREVEAYAKENLKLRSTGGSRSTYDRSAREHGRQAAKSIGLNKAKGALKG